MAAAIHTPPAAAVQRRILVKVTMPNGARCRREVVSCCTVDAVLAAMEYYPHAKTISAGVLP